VLQDRPDCRGRALRRPRQCRAWVGSARACATSPTASWPLSDQDLAPILGRRIKADVIREHWDNILRLVASLQAGTVLPFAMLKRLAEFQRRNQLNLALRELGRIERNLFMLDWLKSLELRQRYQAGLNKSEQRRALAQMICTSSRAPSPIAARRRSSSARPA